MATDIQIDNVEAARRIRNVLLSHRGKEHAITAPAIARAIGLDDADGTRVRAIISEDLELMAAVFGCGRGYFLPETADEVESGFRTLYSRLRKIGRRTVILRRLLLSEGWTESDGPVMMRRWTPPVRSSAPAGKLFDDSPFGFEPGVRR